MRKKPVSRRFKRWIRIHRLTLLITGVMLLFVCRLIWLQFIDVNRSVPYDSHSMLSQSIIQRERGVVLDSGRGQIVDRNGLTIAGQSIQTLVLFPLHSSSMQEKALYNLSRMLHIDREELRNRWLHAKEPIVWEDIADTKRKRMLTDAEAVYIQKQQWNGVYVLPYMERYPWGNQTPHWIGYTSFARAQDDSANRYEQLIGSYGLERAFEPFLKPLGSSTYVHYMDAGKKPLRGLGTRLSEPDNPYYPLKLVTTVDMTIEKKIAQIMDQQQVRKGAVVVLDANTRDVIAMVSRPVYDPYHIDPMQPNWNNQALQAISPGSVFKLVIAAAALETGVTNTQETFTCDGDYHKYGMACWKSEGHGTLMLGDALAESCNVVFAALGERLSSKVIDQYAAKLGLTGTIGMVSHHVLGHETLPHFDLEQAGQVFRKNKQGQIVTDGGVRAQAAIGQRDVRITPLAAANAIVTIIKQGNDGHPRLVSRIEDAKGKVLVSFSEESRVHAGIQPRTAKLLMSWMRQTVTEGTGSALQNSSWSLAGKSGTAQANAYGKERMHSWFVGYGPADQPQYAVAVVSEDENAGHPHKATVVFKKVMEELSEADHKDRKL